jgi:hypothetical protein
MKLWLFSLISCIAFIGNSQIRIDDVGDGWKAQVETALRLIQEVDSNKYEVVLAYCDHISYAMTPYSTTEDGHVILLATAEMRRAHLHDIATAIVHESLHLYFECHPIGLDANAEEALCYAYEIEFLKQIPGVDTRLIDHAMKYYLYYSGR